MSEQTRETPLDPEDARTDTDAAKSSKPREVGGPKGPEPTRYGDWEKKGIASDF